MSANNNINLYGRIARDFEVKNISEKATVVNTVLAVPYYDSREKVEKADFIPIELWNKDALSLINHSGKGLRISIVGELKTESFDKKDGSGKGYKTFVRVDPRGNNLTLIDFKKKDEEVKGNDNVPSNPKNTMDDMEPVDDADIPF